MTDRQIIALGKAKRAFMTKLKMIASQQKEETADINNEIINNIDIEIDRFIAWNIPEYEGEKK